MSSKSSGSDPAFDLELFRSQKSTISLIGPPGAGKSATASLLSSRLGYVQIDTDAAIVAKTGMSVSEIFSSLGEPAFRDLETELLKALASDAVATDRVVSCGGGLPVREENYRLLESMGSVICLYATTEMLTARVLSGETRPLVHSQSPVQTEERINTLMSQRATTYNRPRYRIDTTKLTPAEVCDQIISLLSLV